MLPMWNKRFITKLRVNNAGNFTVEATFVMVIIIGVIMSMLFVGFYCFDRVNVECEVRNNIKDKSITKEYTGQLGKGTLSKRKELNYFSSEYLLNYRLGIEFPLTEQYVENQFAKFNVGIRVCDKKACETIRMYDAMSNKE